jgi:hypothetical protein
LSRAHHNAHSLITSISKVQITSAINRETLGQIQCCRSRRTTVTRKPLSTTGDQPELAVARPDATD